MQFPFPSPSVTSDARQGLVARGGNLSLPLLLAAYQQGIFPCAAPSEPLLWWAPNPRSVFLPKHFHISKSLARRLRTAANLHWRVDYQFATTLALCARKHNNAPADWLGTEMEIAYQQLHTRGYCHSFEAWEHDCFLGGVILVQFGAFFSGETMISAQTNGSKIALAGLFALIKEWPQAIMDCQFVSPHLSRLGAITLPRHRFSQRRRTAMRTAALDIGKLAGTQIKINPLAA